ncbi:MAG: hypothetical protein L6Q76_06680 [Polyangiaceae bacterium]|nr:hypothetical protein [Polyangiaceae bacterium]
MPKVGTVAVHELARVIGRTEQEVLDALDTVGFTARDGQSPVPQAIAERVTQRFQQGRPRSQKTSGDSAGPDSSATGAGEWIELVGPDGSPQAILARFNAEESRRVLENLTRTEFALGRVPHGGNVGPAVVDHLAKASPFVLAGLQGGQVFKVVGTPALVSGLRDGTMTLASTSEGALGTVLQRSSGKIAGQLRFAQASLAPVVTPLLAVQIFHGIAGTAQLSKINARLDGMQRSLERESIRQEAATLGNVRHALHVLDDILAERATTGTFSSDMLMRLARVEEVIGSVVERNLILIEGIRQKLQAIVQRSGKDGAVHASAFLNEEGPQAVHDMRLLVAVMMADHRVDEARLYYALEHAPTDVERRLARIREKAVEYSRAINSLPMLGELQQHARACVEEMGWWERNLTSRGVVREVERAAALPLTSAPRQSAAKASETSPSYVFWQDSNGQIHVKLLAEGDGGNRR